MHTPLSAHQASTPGTGTHGYHQPVTVMNFHFVINSHIFLWSCYAVSCSIAPTTAVNVAPKAADGTLEVKPEQKGWQIGKLWWKYDIWMKTLLMAMQTDCESLILSACLFSRCAAAVYVSSSGGSLLQSRRVSVIWRPARPDLGHCVWVFMLLDRCYTSPFC